MRAHCKSAVTLIPLQTDSQGPLFAHRVARRGDRLFPAYHFLRQMCRSACATSNSTASRLHLKDVSAWWRSHFPTRAMRKHMHVDVETHGD